MSDDSLHRALSKDLSSSRVCLLYELGTMPYREAWDLQRQLAASIGVGGHPPSLLLLEHPHTYTFGRRGEAKNLLWSSEDLAHRNVEVHWVDRGGDVTYHGPGQLVGYPLVRLGKPSTNGRIPAPDYVGYLRRLETLLISVLGGFDIQARRVDGLTGVWVEPRSSSAHSPSAPAKIAAIGVKVDVNGVSTHGFALNVNPAMSYWEGIVPCGIHNHPVTSMEQQLGESVLMEQVRRLVAEQFADQFGFHLQVATIEPHSPGAA